MHLYHAPYTDSFTPFTPFTPFPQASVISSRTGRKPDPSFLHFSAGVVITPDTHEIVTVGGETFDASKTYKAVSYRSLLTGMNEIQVEHSTIRV